MKTSHDPLIGTTFADRYRIERRLGEGGMGCVYLATQLSMDRKVALKVLGEHMAQSKSAIQRFHREMQATARVEHQNTIRVYDYGETDEHQLFLAMELLDGLTLHELLRREGALSTARCLHIAGQIARALGAAHSEGIVHRDLKPENVMLLDRYGERDFVKVLDFGIARFAQGAEPAAGEPQITKAGSLIGTPLYMSPEQALGKPLDGRSDIYALGVLLFQMATGTVPFSDPTPVRVLFMHAHQAPPRASEVAPGRVPATLDELINNLLTKDPDERPQTAVDVGRLLQATTETPTIANVTTELKAESKLASTEELDHAVSVFRDPQKQVPTRQHSIAVDDGVGDAAPTAANLSPVVADSDPQALLVTAPTIDSASAHVGSLDTPASKQAEVTVETEEGADVGAPTMLEEPGESPTLRGTVAAVEPQPGPADADAQRAMSAADNRPPEATEDDPDCAPSEAPAHDKTPRRMVILAGAAILTVAAIGFFVTRGPHGSAPTAAGQGNEKTKSSPTAKPTPAKQAPLAKQVPSRERSALNALTKAQGDPIAPADCQSISEAELAAMISARKKLADGKPRGKRPQDREAAAELIALKSENAEVRALTAKALLWAGANDPDVVEQATRALITCKGLALAHHVAGTVHLQAQRAEQAEKLFATALVHAPTFRAAQFNYGLVAVMRKDGAAAQQRFDKLISEAPRHPGARVGRGQAKLLLKDVRGAIADLQQATRDDDRDANAQLVLGIAHNAAGDKDAAQAAWCAAAALGHPKGQKLCPRPGEPQR